MNRWRVKPVELVIAEAEARPLRRTLGPWSLMSIGVGAIVGTGIFVLPAIGVARAGPGLLLAFLIAGTVCACVALAYAELASIVPVAGSAYTYSYATMGEAVAWIIGWNLILEYAVAGSAVAVGWAGYMQGLLADNGLGLSPALAAGWFDATKGLGGRGVGQINLLAASVVVIATLLLLRGVRESVALNTVFVAIKLLALALFIALALPAVRSGAFVPLLPHGFFAHQSVDPVTGAVATQGVMAAAALMFFTYVGFDAVSTASEEARDPARDVPIGIVASVTLCTLLYILVAICTIGTIAPDILIRSDEPLALVMRTLGHPRIATLLGLAATLTLPAVVMLMVYSQTRVFFAMARDGLLPRRLAVIDARRGTPRQITIITGTVMALFAGLFSLEEISELSNTGTLLAFVAVSTGALILRIARPDLQRRFRCPLLWLVAPIAVGGCLLLLASTPPFSLLRFAAWNAAGAGIYLLFGRRQSRLSNPAGTIA